MKITKRNLLTVILAVLCAVAIVLGVGFVMPKNENTKIAYAGTELYSGGALEATACDELATAAGYSDFGDLVDALDSTSFKASNFGTYEVKFCDMDWWPVQLAKSGEDIVLTLWLKTSFVSCSFSDGSTSSNSATPQPSCNNYQYSWIRAAINAGTTTIPVDGKEEAAYYGSWSGTTQPTKYTNSEPSLSGKVVAPTAFTAFSSIVGNSFIIPGGDYGDALWLPSTDEVKSGGSWGCTSTQWSTTGTTYFWTRSPRSGDYHNAYILDTSGGVSYGIVGPYGVRPALSINLKSAAPAAEPEDVEKEYKGTPYTLADITGDWYDSTKMQIDLPDDMINAGAKKVKVTLTDSTLKFKGTPDTSAGEDDQTRYFTFTIKPKPVQINWATQNHEEGSGGDSFYFLLPSLNVTAEVMSVLSEVKYYQISDYNTSTGVATGSPVTTFEQGKDYFAVTGIKDGLISSNYTFSGNPYYAFNTTDNRTAVVVKIENSGGTYDGKQHAATAKAEKTDGTPLVTGTDIDFLLTYYKDGDSVYENGSTVAPTNAGTYKLVVSIKPAYVEDFKPYGSMEFEYVIEKADPVCNPVRTNSLPLYAGDALPDIVQKNLTDTKGTYSWEAGQSVLQGENFYNYTFTPEDTNNYNEYSGAFSLTGQVADVKSISAEFNLPDGVTIYDSFSLDDLMPYLTVTGVLENGDPSGALYGYTITGTLTEGDSTLTVHYGDKDLTCQFTVEDVVACVLESITADFSQDGNVYTSTDLEDLKAMLTVKGKYNDGRDHGAIDGSDYDLSIDNPDGLVAGAATINVSYWHEGVEYTTTFKVTVKPVVLESISAVFNPGLNEIKSSTSLEKLKNWLTVTGTNNDGSDFGEISADDYTLTGTLKSGTASTITVKYQGKSTTFTVDVAESVDDALKTPIPVPELKDMTYTGNEINVLQGWAHSDLVDITGSKYTDADTYTLTLVIKDPETYKWDTSGLTPVTLARALAGYALAEEFVGYEIDGDTLTATWTIVPAVIHGTWSGGTLSLSSDTYKGSYDGVINYHYFDSNGNEVTELVEGEKYTVTAELADTQNFVFDQETEELLEQEHTYTKEYSFGQKILNFLKKNWWWLLIALAALLLLIIIIVVASRRRKNDDEKKAKKEEKAKREEEQIRALNAVPMAAGMIAAQPQPIYVNGGADNSQLIAEMRAQMAEMRAENRAAQAHQPVTAQPAALPQYQQQPMPYFGQPSGDMATVLAKIEAELAQIRAEQRVSQGYAAPVSTYAPQVYGPQPASEANAVMLAKMEAEFAKMEAQQKASQEVSAAKMELEFFKLHGVPMNYANLYGNNQLAQQSGKPQMEMPAIPQGNDNYTSEQVGAIMAAMMRNMGAINAEKELQPAEDKGSAPNNYPRDAVVTTTTTVDTTQKNAQRNQQPVNDGRLFDVDGFYDSFDENK